MPTLARERLLESARHLFSRNGFRTMGIDAILQEANVAKMSLYKHFKSKDGLIEASLAAEHEEWEKEFLEQVNAASETPTGRILAYFDVMADYFASDAFERCTFYCAVGELPAGHPGRVVTEKHHQAVLRFLQDQCRAAGADSPSSLGKQLLVLVQGATALAQLTKGQRLSDPSVAGEPARQARRAAMTLLREAGVEV